MPKRCTSLYFHYFSSPDSRRSYANHVNAQVSFSVKCYSRSQYRFIATLTMSVSQGESASSSSGPKSSSLVRAITAAGQEVGLRPKRESDWATKSIGALKKKITIK